MEVCHGRIVISVGVISGTTQDDLLSEWLQGASIAKLCLRPVQSHEVNHVPRACSQRIHQSFEDHARAALLMFPYKGFLLEAHLPGSLERLTRGDCRSSRPRSAAAVLDVRLRLGSRGAQLEHFEVGKKGRQVRGDQGPPTAAPFHPNVAGPRPLPFLDRITAGVATMSLGNSPIVVPSQPMDAVTSRPAAVRGSHASDPRSHRGWFPGRSGLHPAGDTPAS
jgi:hypothetical protein